MKMSFLLCQHVSVRASTVLSFLKGQGFVGNASGQGFGKIKLPACSKHDAKALDPFPKASTGQSVNTKPISLCVIALQRRNGSTILQDISHPPGAIELWMAQPCELSGAPGGVIALPCRRKRNDEAFRLYCVM